MNHVYVNGRVHVRQTMCSTCIFKGGNLMHLAEGRVEGMVEGAGDWGCIPCHQHLYIGAPIEPICRGFYDHHRNAVLRLAEMLDVITFIKEENNMVDPMKIECPRCHAGPDEECVTRSGAKAITMHLARIDAVEKQRSSAPPPSTPALVIKYRLPKKLPFRVRDRNHVYCDVHGTIHEAANYSQSSPCSSVDWRRVYVESSDRKEKF